MLLMPLNLLRHSAVKAAAGAFGSPPFERMAAVGPDRGAPARGSGCRDGQELGRAAAALLMREVELGVVGCAAERARQGDLVLGRQARRGVGRCLEVVGIDQPHAAAPCRA